MSDSYWGKYKTILLLSLVYCAGNITLSLTAIPGTTGGGDTVEDPPHWWGCMLGLFLVALGTGGIKPCVRYVAVASSLGVFSYCNVFHVVSDVTQ